MVKLIIIKTACVNDSGSKLGWGNSRNCEPSKGIKHLKIAYSSDYGIDLEKLQSYVYKEEKHNAFAKAHSSLLLQMSVHYLTKTT